MARTVKELFLVLTHDETRRLRLLEARALRGWQLVLAVAVAAEKRFFTYFYLVKKEFLPSQVKNKGFYLVKSKNGVNT